MTSPLIGAFLLSYTLSSPTDFTTAIGVSRPTHPSHKRHSSRPVDFGQPFDPCRFRAHVTLFYLLSIQAHSSGHVTCLLIDAFLLSCKLSSPTDFAAFISPSRPTHPSHKRHSSRRVDFGQPFDPCGFRAHVTPLDHVAIHIHSLGHVTCLLISAFLLSCKLSSPTDSTAVISPSRPTHPSQKRHYSRLVDLTPPFHPCSKRGPVTPSPPPPYISIVKVT